MKDARERKVDKGKDKYGDVEGEEEGGRGEREKVRVLGGGKREKRLPS